MPEDRSIHWTKTWRTPHARIYRAADPRPFAVSRNRYGKAVTIGIAIQVGTRVLSIVWAQPVACKEAAL